MEKIINSCLMLAADLQTPVSLSSIFDSGDLKNTGIEYDSHITLFYAHDRKYKKDQILSEVTKVLDVNQPVLRKYALEGESYFDLNKFLRSEEPVPVFEIFDLSRFENDSDYIVLKLKPSSKYFKILSLLNKGLMNNLDITSDFPDYTPHLSLAELNPGTSMKYIRLNTLRLVLQNSTVRFEDLILSLGESGKSDFKVTNLTNNFNVDRFFRIRDLIKESKDL